MLPLKIIGPILGLLLVSGFGNADKQSKCFTCNSKTDIACKWNLADNLLTECSSDDGCFVRVNNDGDFERGCLSDIGANLKSACTTDSAASCKTCQGEQCNNFSLNLQPFGIWQDLPLNCYTCEGEACATSNHVLRKCEGNVNQDCVTVFNGQGQVISRGCTELVEATHGAECTANPNNCPKCTSSGCNVATSKSEYVECVYCNSATNANCSINVDQVMTRRQCYKQCMTALYPTTNDTEPTYHLVRSCLDDQDLDDREQCSGDKCNACAGSQCNTVAMPESRLSCNHCSGRDCDAPTAKICASYSEKDQCFMRFDRTDSVTEMGCKSALGAAVVNSQLKSLFLCDGDNCNTYANLPDSNICGLCSSSDDESCATAPNMVGAARRCSTYPHTACYSRVNEVGHTERGCLYSLEDEQFTKCLFGNDTLCEICTGNRCNLEVYPKNRPTCHRCDSNDDANCETAAILEPSACPVYSAVESCSTKFKGERTERGCSFELQCGPTDTNSTCRTCTGNNCNSINLEALSIGKLDRWQDLPVQCLHCEGPECSQSLGVLQTCDGDVQQSCVTVFDTTGVVISRGCSDSIDHRFEAQCSAEENCFHCKSSGCNDIVDRSNIVDCVQCDSAKDAGCTFNSTAIARTRKCHKACLTALYPTSASANPAYELDRGCLDDKSLDDRVACQEGADGKCVACTGARCNTNRLPAKRLTCFTCDSAAACKDAAVSQECPSHRENDQCFAQYNYIVSNQVTQMGCASSLEDDLVTAQIKAKRLHLCSGDDCNSVDRLPTYQKCLQCNSLINPECATTGLGASSYNCDRQPFVECVTRILPSGHTERGCLSNLAGDEFVSCLNNDGPNCVSCLGENCNNKIVPENRLSCHTCNSTADASCETVPRSDTSATCIRHVEGDTCLTTYVNGVTHRGCASEIACAEGSTNKSCKHCVGNNCNTDNLKRQSHGFPGTWQDLPLNCMTCSGSDCHNSTGVLRKCETRSNEDCMTVFASNGTVIARGCSATVEAAQGSYCDANADKCINCLSSGCNNMTSLADYQDCLYCDGRNNIDCVFNPSAIRQTRKCVNCMTALYPRSNDSEPAYEVTRTCLEDKDMDDQETCSGTDCVRCEGINCNTAVIPEKRFQCWSCNSRNCDVPTADFCPTYKENDQCFILFNEQNDVTRMGCRSAFDEADVTKALKNILICDGELCNTFDKIPMPNSCAVCNSTSDVNCAVNPSAVAETKKCAGLPYTSCYSRVSLTGETERGCIHDLETEDFLQCQQGYHFCKVCTGEKCNAEAFPEDRRRCHICDSTVDSTCLAHPQSSKLCPIYHGHGYCVSTVVGEEIQRGCAGELLCDSTDRKNCRFCNGDNCNNHDLLANDVGALGTWQDLPINCLTCTGESCANSTEVLRKCESNPHQTCMTVFNATNHVVQRGCSDSVEDTDDLYCEHHPDKCYHCKSSGCNSALAISEYVDCLFCNSTNSEACVARPESLVRTRKCLGQCVVAMYPRSNETNPAFDFVRTCLDDLDYDDRIDCAEGKKEHCQVCSGARCNKDVLPAKHLSCLSCDNGDCEIPTSKVCQTYRADDQCYMLFDQENSVAQMGCKSVFTKAEVEQRLNKLHLCDGDNCNTFQGLPSATFCAVCSSASDPNCATNPEGVRTIGRCGNHPHTQCYMKVTADGTTQRGCLSQLEGTNFTTCLNGDATCQSCSEHNCNQVVFPANRTSCVQCDSSVDPNCASSPGAATICPVYKPNDSCLTSLVNGTTLRGCGSNLVCDSQDRTSCRYCTKDGCNLHNLAGSIIGFPGLWQDLPINCLHCVGEECQANEGVLRKCEPHRQQNCMTVFNETGTVVQRGCSDLVEDTHLEYCEQNWDKCFTCKSSGCNSATTVGDYVDCLVCDSQTNPDCALNATAVSNTRKCYGACMTALYPRVSNSSDPSYELVRTCLDDKEDDDQISCLSGEKYCTACVNANCNVADVVESRFSCNHCVGADCAAAEPKNCSSYKEEDTCFVSFDASNQFVEMGCGSKFNAEDLQTVIRDKRIRFCEGANCNTLTVHPASQCKVCTSKDDERCATNPSAVNATVTCDQQPYTECFTRVNEDGDTERGCVASLEADDFSGCLAADSATCRTCVGDGCNSEIYPENRLSCLRCASTDPANCPKSVCPKFRANETCISVLQDDVIVRGCGSELTCDANDRQNCRICESSDCNTQNLLDSPIGQPGKWQDLPLNCLHCEGADCQTDTGVLRKCNGNDLQTCSTVVDVDGKVVKRGCSDLVDATHAEYCEQNSDKCPGCKSHGCNDFESLDDLVECIFCDSKSNPDCFDNVDAITQTRKCNGGCITGLYELAPEVNPAFGLARTCLSDKDLDDRADAVAGRDPNTQFCSEANCNKDVLLENRLSCFHCKNATCEDPIARSCPNFRAEDQCFMKFDERLSVVQMGCQSEFTWSEVAELVSKKVVHFCKGDNCNTYESLPAAHTCTLCNSKTDALCATSPAEVFSSTRCAKVPYTQCYTRLLTDGHTERGCLSDLEAEQFTTCLDGSSNSCNACVGDSCNSELYPAVRQSCHRCNSLTDPTCATAPNSLELCVRHVANSSCVVEYNSGVTNRGCGYEYPCDTSDRKNCRVCDASGCNVFDLESKQDDNYGKWQDLPLTCLVCAGNNCSTATGVTKQTCTNNNEQDCVIVFDKDGAVVRRGCADDVEDDCAENDANCITCKSNECNSAGNLTEFTDCIYCDSATDENCVFSPLNGTVRTRSCHGACMVALYPATLEENPAFELIRTCLNDKEVVDAELCSNGTDSNCRACQGSMCNSFLVPTENRLSCYHCVGAECEDPIARQCLTHKERDQCFSWLNEHNTVTEMGCASKFAAQDMDDLIVTKRIHLCDGENCNSFENLPVAQECTLCSSKTDINCALRPLDVDSSTRCSNIPNTGCYSRITEDGSTERGCHSSLEGDAFLSCYKNNTELCQSCKGDFCNQKLFPANRPQCHSCSSETDITCQSQPQNLTICPVFQSEGSCITVLRGDTTLRGCSSELACDPTDRKNCRVCSGTGCNTVDLVARQDNNHGKWQDLPLRCHTCSGSECWNTLGVAKTCVNNNEQDCMTVFNNTGQVMRRGCSDEVEDEFDQYCTDNPYMCMECKSNECNVAWNLDEFVWCNYCDSANDPRCISPTNTSGKRRICYKSCMSALYPSLATNGSSFETIHTCLDDKEDVHQHQCGSGEEDGNCRSCSSNLCNYGPYPIDRLRCHFCAGGDCTHSSAAYCPLYKKNDQCVAIYGDNSTISYLGCSSSLHPDTITQLAGQDKLYQCSGSACNNPTRLPKAQECVECNSNDDPNCATNPEAVVTKVSCAAPLAHCYTNVTADTGFTTRGCLNNLNLAERQECAIHFGLVCQNCTTPSCNNKIFPEDRRRCHICNSDDDENCHKDPQNVEICPIYKPFDRCVSRYEDKRHERGCESTNMTCDISNVDNCEICSDDACNTKELKGGSAIITGSIAIIAMTVLVNLIGIH